MADWVKAREFSTGFEAELVRARLESADIPVLIKAHEGGMFGAGFQGMHPSGVELYVPAPLLKEASELLESDVDTESVESSVQTRRSNWAWFLGLLALAALFALGF